MVSGGIRWVTAVQAVNLLDVIHQLESSVFSSGLGTKICIILFEVYVLCKRQWKKFDQILPFI